MKRRYSLESTKYKTWFNIIDHKENKTYFMHITDFNPVVPNQANKQFPGYIITEANELFNASSNK
jgi:hypothetical protein